MKDYEDEAFDDIEKAQQRRVAHGVTDGSLWRKRQTQKEWVGLTEDERRDIYKWGPSPSDAVYLTETKLKQKNT